MPGRDRGEGFYVAAIRKSVQPDSFSEALADVFAEARPSHIASSEQEAQEQLTRVKSLVRRFLRILYDAEKTYASAEPLPQVPLSYDEALQYLRREAVRVEAPRGMVTLCHRGFPLGQGKCVGNRINNLYPMEWRIRSGYTTPFTLF